MLVQPSSTILSICVSVNYNARYSACERSDCQSCQGAKKKETGPELPMLHNRHPIFGGMCFDHRRSGLVQGETSGIIDGPQPSCPTKGGQLTINVFCTVLLFMVHLSCRSMHLPHWFP